MAEGSGRRKGRDRPPWASDRGRGAMSAERRRGMRRRALARSGRLMDSPGGSAATGEPEGRTAWRRRGERERENDATLDRNGCTTMD